MHETKIYLSKTDAGVTYNCLQPLSLRLDQVIGYFACETEYHSEEAGSVTENRIATTVILTGGYDITIEDKYEEFRTAYLNFASGLVKFRKN